MPHHAIQHITEHGIMLYIFRQHSPPIRFRPLIRSSVYNVSEEWHRSGLKKPVGPA